MCDDDVCDEQELPVCDDCICDAPNFPVCVLPGIPIIKPNCRK